MYFSVFFFKQKTAYEILYGLVGSEMGIRDRYMLQCRAGKRTGTAALNMAMDMLHEKLIDEKTAVLRVDPAQLDELLHPICNPDAEKKVKTVVKGLPAGPGAAVGKVVFTAEDAVAWFRKGEKVILLREETNPEDVEAVSYTHLTLPTIYSV